MGTHPEGAVARLTDAAAPVARGAGPCTAPGPGQTVDVAIYESIFNVMEAIVPEFNRLGNRSRSPAALPRQGAPWRLTQWRKGARDAVVSTFGRPGKVRGPSGSTITGIAPTNTYPCQDGRYVVIGANGESIFRRLAEAIGRPDLVRAACGRPGRGATTQRMGSA